MATFHLFFQSGRAKDLSVPLYERLRWIQLAQKRDKWCNICVFAMTLKFPRNGGEFLQPIRKLSVTKERLLYLDAMGSEKHAKTFLYLTGFNTLWTGLLNCLNARSRGLTFRHRASCM